MHSSAIVREARQLHSLSDRLDSLAERHPLVSEAFITISGNIRYTALLEGLVVRDFAHSLVTRMRCLTLVRRGRP
jgi:hypothetical protein